MDVVRQCVMQKWNRAIDALIRRLPTCFFLLYTGLQRVSATPFAGVRVSQRFPFHPDVGLDVVEGSPSLKIAF